MVASDPLKAFDSVWWLEYVTSQRYRLGAHSDFMPLWDSVCSVAAVQGPIPPRFVELVSSLGRRSTDRDSFMNAVKILRVLPRFCKMSDLLSKNREASECICCILIADGLVSPAAALWLSLNSLLSCDDLLRKFPRAHILACKSRNKAVRAQLSVPENLTTAEPLVIGSSDEGDSAIDDDVEIVPESRPKCSQAGGSRRSLRGSEVSQGAQPKHQSKSESAASVTFSSKRKNPV